MLQRAILVLGLVLSLCVGLSTAEAAKAKKKNKGLRGVVTAVDQNTDGGTITVKVMARKKAPAPPEAEAVKKIQISKDTKFEKVSGKKGAQEMKPATFADVKTGERVQIVAKSGQAGAAEKVVIQEGKKKKKKKQS